MGLLNLAKQVSPGHLQTLFFQFVYFVLIAIGSKVQQFGIVDKLSENVWTFAVTTIRGWNLFRWVEDIANFLEALTYYLVSFSFCKKYMSMLFK